MKRKISLAGYDGREGVVIRLRGQGSLKYWKIVLTDSEFLGLTKLYTYEVKFPVNLEAQEFEVVNLPFSDFRAFFRGREISDAPAMDLQKLGSFGIQTFGGVYDTFKQQGVGSLEIDY